MTEEGGVSDGGNEVREEAAEKKGADDRVSTGGSEAGGGSGGHTGKDEESDKGGEDGEAGSPRVGGGREKCEGRAEGGFEHDLGRRGGPVGARGDGLDGVSRIMEGGGEAGAEDETGVGDHDGAATGASSKNSGGFGVGHAIGDVDEGGADSFADGSVGGEEARLMEEGGEDLGEGVGLAVGGEEGCGRAGGVEEFGDLTERVGLPEGFKVDACKARKAGGATERGPDVFFSGGMGGEDGG